MNPPSIRACGARFMRKIRERGEKGLKVWPEEDIFVKGSQVHNEVCPIHFMDGG